MTLAECKDQVAREKNFKDWNDMLVRDHYINIELRHDKAAILYAQECCKATLAKAAENASVTILPGVKGSMVMRNCEVVVVKSSITDEQNIVLL